jgi:hypothetical protein
MKKTGIATPTTRARTAQVEGHLMAVAEPSSVGFEPGEIVAGLQIHDPLVRVEPVHADLAREPAVPVRTTPSGMPSAKSSAACSWARTLDGHRVDHFELFVGQYRLTLLPRPIRRTLPWSRRTLARLLVDRAADGEVGVEGSWPSNASVWTARRDQVRRPIFIGDDPSSLLDEKLRALAEVRRLRHRQVLLGLSVVSAASS